MAFSPSTSKHRPQTPASRPAKARARDPHKPKRALSAYVFFAQTTRPQIKEKHPDATFGEVGRMLGQMWGELNDQQKKPFQVLADQDKRRAEREMAAYNANAAMH